MDVTEKVAVVTAGLPGGPVASSRSAFRQSYLTVSSRVTEVRSSPPEAVTSAVSETACTLPSGPLTHDMMWKTIPSRTVISPSA